MTDCMIIGSGAAGISAALTLKANGKDFMLLGSRALSEKIEKAEKSFVKRQKNLVFSSLWLDEFEKNKV